MTDPVLAAALPEAVAEAWRDIWVESAALGWHVQTWFDEDVLRRFEDGTVADAILPRLEAAITGSRTHPPHYAPMDSTQPGPKPKRRCRTRSPGTRGGSW